MEFLIQEGCGERFDSLLRLLGECDGDFVPPISSRPEGIAGYAGFLWDERLVLAVTDHGDVAGVLSYIPDFRADDGGKVAYVTTLCVLPGLRGRGIARRLYGLVETHARNDRVMLSTWSTNKAQLHLMEALGYSERRRVRDARGRGVDTIVFEKTLGLPTAT